jgi:peptidoglycan/xylan/chitin deacetylase (PgdA/CDA1 family)
MSMSVSQAVKRRVRHLLAALLYYSGLARLYARRSLRGKAVVLMYHRVLTRRQAAESFSHPGIIVTDRSFARHLQVIRRHLRPLSADAFLSTLERGEAFQDGSCLVTFDDGWVDNHAQAHPELRRHGIPALIFLATDYIGSRDCFWQEKLGHLFYRALESVPGRAALEDLGLDPGDSDDENAVRARVQAWVAEYRRRPYDQVTAAIDILCEALSIAPADAAGELDRFLDWAQVRAMQEDGIRFGAHTCSHRILTRLAPAVIARELHDAPELIGRETGHRPRLFAYPNGDFDADIAGQVRAAGYGAAFSTVRGHVSANDDRYAIRRVNIHEGIADTAPLFYCRVVGLL